MPWLSLSWIGFALNAVPKSQHVLVISRVGVTLSQDAHGGCARDDDLSGDG